MYITNVLINGGGVNIIKVVLYSTKATSEN